jgi:uncharacterized damage-inducible protein DinB
MKSEIERITALLQQTFTKEAWHGPTVLEAIAKVTPGQVSARASANTHSIIELVAHMRAWRIAAIEWLSGNTTYTVTDALNFPAVTDWSAAVAALRESQEKLIAAIAAFPEERLDDTIPETGNAYTWYDLLHGVINHDTYHTGQISMIAKATATT